MKTGKKYKNWKIVVGHGIGLRHENSRNNEKITKTFKLRYGGVLQGGAVYDLAMFGNVYYGKVRNKDRSNIYTKSKK